MNVSREDVAFVYISVSLAGRQIECLGGTYLTCAYLPNVGFICEDVSDLSLFLGVLGYGRTLQLDRNIDYIELGFLIIKSKFHE